MSDAELFHIISYIWAIFGGYWRGAASNAKTVETGEAQPFRWLRWLVLAITFTLIFFDRTAVGIFGRRFIPVVPLIAYCGFAITLAGLFLAIRARSHLAQYWSDMVGVQSDHQLIRTGPYAYMRHPIYSGVLLAIAGTVLIQGQWRGVLAFLLQFVSWTIKARKEEHLLAMNFGPSFQEHLRRTGFFFPRFHTRV